MRKFYWTIGIFLLLVVCAVIFYLFNKQIIALLNFGADTTIQAPLVSEPEDIPLTKEETVELLSELLPEDPIDTPEEITEQEDLLRQLQEQAAPPALDAFGNDVSSQLDNLTNELPSEEEQLELLRELQ